MNKTLVISMIVLFIVGLSTLPLVAAHAETGVGSYYGNKFHGKRTASGSIYNMNDMTAAHKTLPFGTKVRVTNLKNNKSVVLKITDRGPYVRGRVIDVSKKANGILKCDLCKVVVVVLTRGDGKYRKE